MCHAGVEFAENLGRCICKYLSPESKNKFWLTSIIIRKISEHRQTREISGSIRKVTSEITIKSAIIASKPNTCFIPMSRASSFGKQ